MPFVPVENTALVETRMLYDNQQVENTLWVLNPSGWDGESLAGLAAAVRDWWSDSYAILISNTVSLREVVATDMTTDSGAQASVDGGGLTGIDTGQGMPGNVSLTVSFRTAQRGRSFRGRNYIVGIPRGFIEEESTASEDYQATVVSNYSGLLTGSLPLDTVWVVASRFSGVDPDTHKPIPRAAGVVTPITTVLLTDPTVDSQRRRLPGRGK